MEIYLVRHGIAAARRDWQGEDADRPLTDEGKAQIQREAAGIARLELPVSVILSSPYARAFQTAEIIAKQLDLTKRLVQDPRLEYGFGRKKLREIIADHPDAQALMLVGHEPDFSKLIRKLTGGQVKMEKGAVAGLAIQDGNGKQGELLWLLPPQMLAM
jgi:phosphohistidine phosphatase